MSALPTFEVAATTLRSGRVQLSMSVTIGHYAAKGLAALLIHVGALLQSGVK